VSDQQTSDNLSSSVDKEVFCCGNCSIRLTCFSDEAEYVRNKACRSKINTPNFLVLFASICQIDKIQLGALLKIGNKACCRLPQNYGMVLQFM
jgi:hypothetical protein